MDELTAVKAAMAKRGATWRGGYEGEEMELFREVDGEREALIVGYTGKPPHRRWWVDTWDHRRASRGLGAVLGQVEAEYRKTAAKALRRAEELAEVRYDIERAKLARTNAYGTACLRLHRRIQSGESGAEIDAEKARLDTEWLALTDEERARLMGASGD